jgi:uncharacterized protein (TIGR02246 family)
MRFLALLSFFCCIHISSLSQSNLKYNSKDLAALNALPVKWQQYWNMHNMDSMGTLLRQDADFINVGGVWLKGKAAVVKDHKAKHEGIKFKTSIWETDSVAIKYLKPDVAIVHIGWGIKGDFEDDGTPRKPRHGIFTWVVCKQNSRWLLTIVQNTNSRDTTTSLQ